jgi:hypothetical protein
MHMSTFNTQKKAFLAVAMITFIALPVLSFGKGGSVIYVDKNASGQQDGSKKNPYKSISKALDKAKKGSEVRVLAGTYKETITIPRDVKLVSDAESRDKVTIDGGNSKKPTVVMKEGSKVSSVTIKNGFHGIRVNEGAKAQVYNVTIKGATRDGVHIDKGAKKESDRVLIDKSYIAKNGMAGVYSDGRMVTILGSDIDSNKLDGIDLRGSNKAWIEKTRVRWNGASGLKGVIDGSTIRTSSSDFRNNHQAGVEAISFGGSGTLEVKRGSIVGNASYGVAKVQKAGKFNGLVLSETGKGIKFKDNGKGNISGILSSF